MFLSDFCTKALGGISVCVSVPTWTSVLDNVDLYFLGVTIVVLCFGGVLCTALFFTFLLLGVTCDEASNASFLLTAVLLCVGDDSVVRGDPGTDGCSAAPDDDDDDDPFNASACLTCESEYQIIFLSLWIFKKKIYSKPHLLQYCL